MEEQRFSLAAPRYIYLASWRPIKLLWNIITQSAVAGEQQGCCSAITLWFVSSSLTECTVIHTSGHPLGCRRYWRYTSYQNCSPCSNLLLKAPVSKNKSNLSGLLWIKPSHLVRWLFSCLCEICPCHQLKMFREHFKVALHIKWSRLLASLNDTFLITF